MLERQADDSAGAREQWKRNYVERQEVRSGAADRSGEPGRVRSSEVKMRSESRCSGRT